MYEPTQEETSQIMMWNLQNKINAVLLQYALLHYTEPHKDWGMVDFDNFRGIYQDDLEYNGMDVSSYGCKIGLLSKYEDELYDVDANVWQKLYDELMEKLKCFPLNEFGQGW